MAEIAEAVLERSGYVAELEASSDLQDASRIENLNELVAVAREFDALRGQAGAPEGEGAGPEAEEPGRRPGSLADFLEQVSLVADADQIPEGEDRGGRVTLMTLHTAKGLEFPVVFLTGMEENVFPHQRAVNDPKELQEERRLAYVGITRAERRLYLTRAAARAWWAGRNTTGSRVSWTRSPRTSSSGAATSPRRRRPPRSGWPGVPGSPRPATGGCPRCRRGTRSPTTPTAWARSCPCRVPATTPRRRSISAASTASSTWCCGTRRSRSSDRSARSGAIARHRGGRQRRQAPQRPAVQPCGTRAG